MIRPMTAADVPAVKSLQTQLEYADPELVDAAVCGPFYGRVAVAGAPAGYAIVLPGTPATLAELVVAPAHRRHGHGRALVEAVDAAVDATTIEVLTPADNDAARRFYAAIGFEPAGRRPDFYTDGTDASRLVRSE